VTIEAFKARWPNSLISSDHEKKSELERNMCNSFGLHERILEIQQEKETQRETGKISKSSKKVEPHLAARVAN
jgi:hypothetical protein